MFFDRFRVLCEKKGISIYRACTDIGLNRSSVAKWKNGSTPNGTTLQKLADYFGVSVDYLLEKETSDRNPFSTYNYENDTLSFYCNFINLCNQVRISPSAAAVKMGFQKSVVTRWSRGSIPTKANQMKIAAFFGVTVDELMNSQLSSSKEKEPTAMFFDRFLDLCTAKGVKPGRACVDMGVSRSLAAKWKNNGTMRPSTEVLEKMSAYFGISIDEILEKEPTEDELTAKDRRDIARDLEALMADLENGDDLMIDGDPATPEAIYSIRNAMAMALEYAKKVNREGGKNL